MSLQVLFVSLLLLFGAPSITGYSVDCATFEFNKAYVNGTLLLDVKTDYAQAHVLVQKVSSDDGVKTPIMSVNADPNSVPNLTFYGKLGLDYENRTSVNRTATKSRESQDIIFTIGSVESGDGGIYSVENAHSRHKKCFHVAVHADIASKPGTTGRQSSDNSDDGTFRETKDCASPNTPFELKKVNLGENLTLLVETDHKDAHVFVKHVTSDGIMPVVSTNADSDLTDYGNNTGKYYANRTSVHRTTAQPGGPQNVSVTIRSAEFDDGGIYSAKVENSHPTPEICYKVYIIGPPMKPELTVYKGNATDGRFARFLCTSTSTTSPRNPDWPLTYNFRLNDNEITPASDINSTYMVRGNELMIADLAEADDKMRVTCSVQEENGQPSETSTTVILSVPSVKHAGLGRSRGLRDDGSHDKGMGMDCNCSGWIGVTVLCIVVIIVGFLCVIAWCKPKRQCHLCRKDKEAEFSPDETGSMILSHVDDGGTNG